MIGPPGGVKAGLSDLKSRPHAPPFRASLWNPFMPVT